MDKLIQLCTRSIIQLVNGNMELSGQYKELALHEYDNHKNVFRVEDQCTSANKEKII
ncbi:MAG: hypothetical protein GX053_02000 [Tissierella sp.]|nr:hypothetical protein [Tissierella sp.]